LGLYQNFALNNKFVNIPQIDVYEKDKLGGRIRTIKVLDKNNPNDYLYQSFADIGANFIDYESEQEKKYIQSKLSKQIKANILPFKHNFLLFHNNQLKKTE
jgi:hypothetical protein